MKYTKRLYKKFFRKRVYRWDLILHDEDGKHVIVRFIDGRSMNKLTDSKTNKKVDIPEKVTNYTLQIAIKLRRMNWVDAYLLARKICKINPKFKVRVYFILKELR